MDRQTDRQGDRQTETEREGESSWETDYFDGCHGSDQYLFYMIVLLSVTGILASFDTVYKYNTTNVGPVKNIVLIEEEKKFSFLASDNHLIV